MINTPEIRVDCPDDQKFAVVAARRPPRLRSDPAVHGVVDIDGVRAKFDGGWGLVRASNTQPALVMRCEADSAERLAEIRGRSRRIGRGEAARRAIARGKIGIDLGGTNLRARRSMTSSGRRRDRKEAVGEPRDPADDRRAVALVIESLSGRQGASVGDRHRGDAARSARHGRRTRRTCAGAMCRSARCSRRGSARASRSASTTTSNAIVYGESVSGAARGRRDVLGVLRRHGHRRRLIVNGRLVEGTSNCAGGIGHARSGGTTTRHRARAASAAASRRTCGGHVVTAIEPSRGRREVRDLSIAGGARPGPIAQSIRRPLLATSAALALWRSTAPLLVGGARQRSRGLDPERLCSAAVARALPTLYRCPSRRR